MPFAQACSQHRYDLEQDIRQVSEKHWKSMWIKEDTAIELRETIRTLKNVVLIISSSRSFNFGR